MPIKTEIQDVYWRFAHERHSMWIRRMSGEAAPWTSDPILEGHRFTNAYRVLDRVSQHLIREIQYGETRSQAPDELFFRTILFKTFNKVETWDLLEDQMGRISWQSFDPGHAERILDSAMKNGARVYSSAYIMPAPPFGQARKHANHIRLIMSMMDQALPYKISQTKNLKEVYELLLQQPGIGRFLAFQYAIDLNYSNLIDHQESDFVVAGPGAIDGLSKCFSDHGTLDPEDTIMEIYESQEAEFARLGIDFQGLYGRPLQPIDIQNCYCEISKYTRASHPDIVGVAGRTRIKQTYGPSGLSLPTPFLPPKWGLEIPTSHQSTNIKSEATLF